MPRTADRLAPKKKPFSPPVLTCIAPRAEALGASAHHSPAPQTEVAGMDAGALLERYGSPLFVFDEKRLRENYTNMHKAFTDLYPETQIAFSVKTNYLSAIVALFRDMGAWGEVVSGFEYTICRDLGIPGKEIIFNGPWKSDDELARAFREGAIVNLDGLDEIERAEGVAERLKLKPRVGVRLNMKLYEGSWDKFGLNAESGEALAGCQRVIRGQVLRLSGLHVHAGTYVDDPAVYRKAVGLAIDLALKLERDHKLTIGFIDMGGGYATTNTLRGHVLRGEATCPTPAMYAAAICEPLRAARDQWQGPAPVLFIEPGRALVDDACTGLTTVLSTKRLAGEGSCETAVIVDIGVHLLPTAYWYDHDVVPIKLTVNNPQMTVATKLLGPLCMQIDVVRKHVALPPLRPGDTLMIRTAGAYNFSQSMQFIQIRPAYIMVASGEAHVIREPEKHGYVRALEALPPYLLNAETRGSILNRKDTAGQ